MIRNIFSLTMALVWCISNMVQAGISAPIPFAKLNSDESKILIIRNGGDGFGQDQVNNPRLSNGDEIDFLAVYPSSGLYETTSRRLIYPIDWFCLEKELLVDSDLEHIARLNRFGVDWALKFYSHGVETNSYKLDSLLKSFMEERYRPLVTWDYFHPWHEDFKLRGGQVIVTTVEREISGFRIGYNETLSFDLVTGNLQNTEAQNRPLLILRVVIGLLVITIVYVALAAVSSRRGSNRLIKPA